MKTAKTQELRNFDHLKYGFAIGLGFTGLIAALGSFANTEVSPPERMPQIDMYSTANIKFPLEKAKDPVFTSDAWLSNSIGKTHVPIPHLHR